MLDLKKLFDLGRWFDAFPGPPGTWYLVALVGFIIWTIGSIVLYLFRGRIFAGNPALKGMVTRFWSYAFTIGLLGLFFVAVRYASIPYFDMRVFLYLTILLAVGFVGFIVYYLKARYPKRVAELQAEALRRKYASTSRRRRR